MKTINQPEPIDLSRIKDNGVKAIILLGVSLGLALRFAKNSVMLLSPNATTALAAPLDAGLRANKYRSAVQQVCRFVDSDEYRPGAGLVDAICRKTHCPPEKQRWMRMEVAAWWPHTIVAGEPDMRPSEEEVAQVIASVKEIIAEPETLEFIERPAISHMSNGIAYESKAAVERIWPDGTKTIHCNICYQQVSSVRGIGGHRKMHVRKDGVKPIGDPDKSQGLGLDPDWEITEREQKVMEMKATAYNNLPEPPPLPDPDDPKPELDLIDQIRGLVLPGLVDEIERLRGAIRLLTSQVEEAERLLDAARSERDQLRSSLDALRDMISDLTKEGGG